MGEVCCKRTRHNIQLYDFTLSVFRFTRTHLYFVGIVQGFECVDLFCIVHVSDSFTALLEMPKAKLAFI